MTMVPVPIAAQEFKQLVTSGLRIPLAAGEAGVLAKWFGNGHGERSAAIDLNLFFQQFWALGQAPIERSSAARVPVLSLMTR
jgi:hypothetical protein